MRDPIDHLRRSARNDLIGGIVALLLLIPIVALIVVVPNLVVRAVGGLSVVGILIFVPTQIALWLEGPYRYLVLVHEDRAKETRAFCQSNIARGWREFDSMTAQTAFDHAFTFRHEQDAALVKLFCS